MYKMKKKFIKIKFNLFLNIFLDNWLNSNIDKTPRISRLKIRKKLYWKIKKTEIINALKKNKKKLNIKNLEKNLYTKNMPDPDILIRTGGYQRLSNFLLW